MIKQFIQQLFKKDEFSQTSWKPLEHSFVKDGILRQTLHRDGLVVAGTLDAHIIEELKALYAEQHDFNAPSGGMFYSVYSKDLAYRKKVNDRIEEILKSVYDDFFDNYKTVINSFIVKVSGPESEFSLHQDSTGLDEMSYSCLSVWIPLQDTTIENGCMCVVPRSHQMFSPYRGISFPEPFHNIQDEVKKYLVPVEMKAGEILLFDNRLVHNSLVNDSGQDRVVIMSGIFPQEAKIISCYKDMTNETNLVEIIEQDEDYLLTFENFFHDCTCRPETGKSLGFVNWDTRQLSKQEFTAMCRKYGVHEVNHSSLKKQSKNPSIIGEPHMGAAH